MNPQMVNKQIAGERAELYVFGELLKRGMVPYVPLVDQGLDALVRTPAGRVIELQIKAAGSAGGKYPRWFAMPPIEPRNTFFIVGVEFTDGEPGDVWVLPSTVFDKYAGRPPKGLREIWIWTVVFGGTAWLCETCYAASETGGS